MSFFKFGLILKQQLWITQFTWIYLSWRLWIALLDQLLDVPAILTRRHLLICMWAYQVCGPRISTCRLLLKLRRRETYRSSTLSQTRTRIKLRTAICVARGYPVGPGRRGRLLVLRYLIDMVLAMTRLKALRKTFGFIGITLSRQRLLNLMGQRYPLSNSSKQLQTTLHGSVPVKMQLP